MSKKSSKKDYPVSSERAWVVSLLITLFAIILLIVGGVVASPIARSILNALASTLLAVGMISFLYEFFLRATVGKEMLKLVGIKESLSKNQVNWAGRESEVDWQQVFSNGNSIYILLPEPSWLHQYWDILKKKAGERRVSITLLLPKSDGVSIEHIANFLSTNPADLTMQINEASNMVEKSWVAARSNKTLEAGSVLKIVHFEQFPSYAIIASDQTIVTTIFSPTHKAPLEKGFSMSFYGSAKDYPISWFLEKIKDLSKTPATFENEVPNE